MRIAVSAWSFHESLYAGKLAQTDVPAEVAALGLRHVELLEVFLWRKPPGRLARLFKRAAPQASPAVDYARDTLNELRGARLRAGTALVCWDADTDLTVTEADARRAQLAHLATAIQAAKFLGAPMVRITTGGEAGDTSAVGRAVDMLRTAVPVAVASGVRLAIENHGGLSADAQALAEIVAAFNSPTLGVCLDLGNFRAGEADAGLSLLAPRAVHVHCKSHTFDARGEDTQINYGAAMQALRSAGYDGVLSIEFEGDGSPAHGIRKTRALIDKYWNGSTTV